MSRPGCQLLAAVAQSVLRIWLLVSQNCVMCLPALCGPCLLFATTSGLRGTCPLLANSSSQRGNCPLLADSSSLRGSRAHDSSISTEMMELSDRAIAGPTCNATSCLLPIGFRIGLAATRSRRLGHFSTPSTTANLVWVHLLWPNSVCHVATFYLWALLARSGQRPRRDLGRSQC